MLLANNKVEKHTNDYMSIFSAMATETTDKVKDYYGKRVKCQDDLQTQACIADDTVLPKYIKEILSQVHDEVMSR